MVVEENVEIAKHTTFKTGGTTRLFITCESEQDVRDAVTLARERNLPIYVLGGGSNVLAADGTIEKAILKISIPGIIYQEKGTEVVVTIGAGVSWDTFVDEVTGKKLWGVENLAGIPGTVGGAAVQNIGAYGAVFADSIRSVSVYDTTTDTYHSLLRDECAYGYRDSIFKQRGGELIVTSVTVSLSKKENPKLAYKDLQEYFADSPTPSLIGIRDALRIIRGKKFPDLSMYGTAGSFFLNPVLSHKDAERIAATYPGMPLFPMPEGGVKVPIAWLLDYRHGVLDMRDVRVGNAFVWTAQPLVLVSEYGATSADVLAVAAHVISTMKEATGIDIQKEVQILS